MPIILPDTASVKTPDPSFIIASLQATVSEQGKRITELEEKLRWIPVTERLPEAGLEVECAYDIQPAYSVHRIIFIGSFNMYGDWEFISADGSICNSCIPIMFWREVPEL